ncbi:cytochrome c family protein [Burkholderia pseudomallei 406e]|uniref:Cytochrome c family protein n=1 Tax=Burkholderia pseudomallei 1710a TaxID=320371 RepID=A0A0E1W7K0_BURPE|nr:c-type cytochrome [Burkholderia pseudomallei]ABO04076.1 cytochrome c family protein [Burkholderia mallei NCTC 10247]ACQ98529.1 cytochrome c family protein [Burkholderia pseudomallei MSHR346]AFR17847.1 cytochrome c family protein [Burkholderia pseudomallei BPC006]EBA47297.1 cytochrome c family protein [Burkholderia pseudomallei 305]EDK54554.1 cytochrome c family protein [Burkholderia mallei FMH]EDK59526.1 cytochrome c family protein [Burkholderia mallei JHU]EDO85726.1 cytochrome c family p
MIPIAIIVLFATYANHAFRTGAGTDGLSDEAVAKRIAPLAQVDIKDANAPRVYKTGEEVYKAVCVTCHGTGAAGAPKFGDAAAWAPRIAAGYDEVLHLALTGKGAMPPRGGTNPDDYSDYEIARAVVYMANQGGAKFAEPAQPAANAAPASGAAAASAPGASDAAANSQAAAAMAAIAALPKAGEAPAAGANAESSASAGKALYESTCQACHATGVLNAPKFGNKADWAPRLKDSMDTVYNFALHGKGAMPPKGGSNASDADVKAAVDYMVNAAK